MKSKYIKPEIHYLMANGEPVCINTNPTEESGEEGDWGDGAKGRGFSEDEVYPVGQDNDGKMSLW